MEILLTGVTGQVGRATAEALIGRGIEFRGLVRDPTRVRGLGGAKLTRGVFENAAAVRRAMQGVEVLLLAGRDNPHQVSQADVVLRAAAEADVRYVVKLSSIGARADSPIELLRHHGIVEQALAESAMDWTVVRPHFFMQNLLRVAEPVRLDGRLRVPMGEAPVPLVDTRDVGETLAAILAAPETHVGAVYTLTGPEAVPYANVARELAAVAGRDVIYEPLAPADYERELRDVGMPGWRAYDLAWIASSFVPADLAVTQDVPRLLGRAPRSLQTFLSDHRHVFAAAPDTPTMRGRCDYPEH
jgi:uncharacterized protein YbjT (DUF2867 family)